MTFFGILEWCRLLHTTKLASNGLLQTRTQGGGGGVGCHWCMTWCSMLPCISLTVWLVMAGLTSAHWLVNVQQLSSLTHPRVWARWGCLNQPSSIHTPQSLWDENVLADLMEMQSSSWQWGTCGGRDFGSLVSTKFNVQRVCWFLVFCRWRCCMGMSLWRIITR